MGRQETLPHFSLVVGPAPLHWKDSILVSLSSLLGGSWKSRPVAQHLSFPTCFSQAVRECCTCLCLPQGGPVFSPCPASCLDEQALRAGLQRTIFG